MTTDRTEPPVTGPEREMLRAFLDFHRDTLAMKCEGLSDDQLREQSSPPSALSLLGLVRHMAEVERTWFRRVINGEDLPLVWSDDGDFQAAYAVSQPTPTCCGRRSTGASAPSCTAAIRGCQGGGARSLRTVTASQVRIPASIA
jgi:hypothetical protein